MRPRFLLLALAGALALGLTVAVAARLAAPSEPSFHGTAYVPYEPAPEFRLVAHTGRPATLADFRGSAALLFFGFANCPDVCPLTLARLQRVVGTLGDDAERVRVLLVTVDPARDTPEALARYVAPFGPHVHGLTGDSATLAAVRAAYGVYAGAHPVQHGISITHTPSVFGVDARGRLRVLLSLEQSDEELADDVRALIRSD